MLEDYEIVLKVSEILDRIGSEDVLSRGGRVRFSDTTRKEHDPEIVALIQDPGVDVNLAFYIADQLGPHYFQYAKNITAEDYKEAIARYGLMAMPSDHPSWFENYSQTKMFNPAFCPPDTLINLFEQGLVDVGQISDHVDVVDLFGIEEGGDDDV